MIHLKGSLSALDFTGGISIKKEKRFVGLLILAGGAFLLLNQWHLLAHQKWAEWPYLLLVFGAAFFIYGWAANESDLLFPAFLIFGLGLHAFIPGTGGSWWSQSATFYPLLMGIGFLIRYFKGKKQGLFIGLVLILFSLYPLFSKMLSVKLYHYLGAFSHYWPVLLVLIGLFLFFRKK